MIALGGYLITKPAGVTAAEVVNEKSLDRRKLSALKFRGLSEAGRAEHRHHHGRLDLSMEAASACCKTRRGLTGGGMWVPRMVCKINDRSLDRPH
jgi:hypothetical protein